MNRFIKRTLKFILIAIGTVLMLLVLLVLSLQIPGVQNYITHKAVEFVSGKTHTRISINRLYIGFPKTVVIEGLFAEDLKHDTLLSVQKLTVDIGMLGLLHKTVAVKSVTLTGATAHIERNTDSVYNFGFFIKAFSPAHKVEVAKKNTVKTDTADWVIQVDRVALENITGGFSDAIGGTVISGHVGKLNLDMKAIDLKHLSFNGNSLAISNTDLQMVQNKQGAETPDTSITLMPLLSLNNLQLHQVSFIFENKVNGQLYSIHAGDASLLPQKIDLNGHVIQVNKINISATSAVIALRKNVADTTKITATQTKPAAPWQISADSLNLQAVNFKLDITNVPRLKSGVDYNHLGLTNANIDITGASYTHDKIEGNIHNISVNEQSGLQLQKLTAKVIYNNSGAQLKDLSLITNHSNIQNYLAVTYTSINDIGKNVGNLGIDGNFNNTRVGIEDILLFVPQLKTQPIFMANRGKTVVLTGRVRGKVNNVIATELHVDVTGGTSVALNAHITGLPDAINAYYDVDLQSLHTTAADLQQLTGGSLPTSINYPQSIELSGHVLGTLKNATASLSLKSSAGGADVEASMHMNKGDTAYAATITTHALDIGYILKQDTLLGPVTMNADIKGHSLALSQMRDTIQATIDAVRFNKYNYQNITLNASSHKGRYSAAIAIKDSNLIMNLQAEAALIKDSEFVKASGHIEGAAFQKLKLLKEDIRASGYLAANLTGNPVDMNGTVRLDDLVIQKTTDAYHIDSIVVISVNDSSQSKLIVTSPMLKADYSGNIKVQNLPATITHYLNQYFKLTADTVMSAGADTSNKHFKLAVNVLPHPIINMVLPGLQNFDGAEVTSSFNKNNNAFKLDADISALAYSSIKAKGVHVGINNSNKELKYALSLQDLETGPVRLAETSLSGTVANNMVNYALRIHGKDTVDKLLITGNFNQDSTKAYVLHFDNQGLVIDNDKWNLAQDNYIRFGTKGFEVHHLDLSNKEQVLSVNTEPDLNTIKINLSKFQLGSLSQIIEQDTPLVRGVADGNVEFKNLKNSPAFVSDLKINNITYLSRPIGNLSVKADNLTADKYTAQVILNGFDNDVTVNGYYAAATTLNQLNFKVDIKRLNISSVEPFAAGQLRRSTGYLTGTLAVDGSVSQPQITGDIGFKDVAFNLAYINNYLTLKDEHIAIDSKGIYFKSFNILDSLKQKASIAGAIYTSDFKNMIFDITMNTDNFTVLNTTIKDNPLFFGKVILNSDIRVTGNQLLPVVNVNAKLVDGSRLAVVIPTSKISTDRGEGVVVLTDTETINNLMNPKDTLLLTNTFKGIDLSANLEVTKETTFKVIVDKSSGDSLVVRGDGVLSFTMDETGNQSLTGTYNIDSGSYRASFQKVIKRELTIQQGGSIIWNGSPTDATINLTAVYSIKTAPADLLSSELANAASGERNTYNTLVNFNVLMSMKGELLKPEINFKLDMNPEDQGILGGTVYAKIVSVDNDPSELNKQVFALLVMGKFIPATIGGSSTGSTSYGDVASNLARNSINQILTNELNALSGRFIKGVDINVGVNANDAYTNSGTTQNTQISASVKKSFFNERLSVQVGTSINVQNDNGAVKGGDAQSLTGDIVLEYKVNKDGSLRFKAFRQNQYEDFIDGTITDTGVGVVYNRDFNKIKELFIKHKKKKLVNKGGPKKNG